MTGDAVIGDAVTGFRLATAADAPDLVDLIESAYRGEFSRQGWTTEAGLLDTPRTNLTQVLAVIGDPASMLLVLVEADGLLACCQLERRDAGLAYFGLFAVRPDRQGGGVGRRVMDQAQRLVRQEWGSTALEMTVISLRTELIAWYQRLGFALTGEVRPFPHEGEPRGRDLRFVVLRRELTA